jgi:hypothetical protein
VSAQGIIGGLESFKQAGLQPRWIIIDDGWQVRYGCWSALPVLQQAAAADGDGVMCCRLYMWTIVSGGLKLGWTNVSSNF